MNANPTPNTQVVNITTEEMKAKENLPATVEADTRAGFGSRIALDIIQRAGRLLATSDMVPKQYQGNLANCVIALNMAQRIGADPLMVMQNLYMVHGRPSWSSQFLIATFNSCGRFSAIRYEFAGTPGQDDYGCRAYAVEKETGETLYGSFITIELARKEGWYGKSGSKWQTMPQQMLMYRAASWFVRAYAPEIAMGLHTTEELRDAGPDKDPDTVSVADLKTPETHLEGEKENQEEKPPTPPTPEQKPKTQAKSRLNNTSPFDDDEVPA